MSVSSFVDYARDKELNRWLDDTKSDSDILVKKILSAKLFEDPGDTWGSWKRSVKDIDGEVLCGELSYSYFYHLHIWANPCEIASWTDVM